MVGYWGRARPQGLYGNLGARLPGKLLKNTIKNATSLQKYREGGGGGNSSTSSCVRQ